jgi:molecular chaperone HtpG
MRRMLEAQGHAPPAAAPALELNFSHPLVRFLEAQADEAAFTELAEVLYGQARLNDSGQLDRPADFTRQLNALLQRLGGVK